MQTLEQVAREKGLPLKVIVEAMVTAIELAARKRDKTSLMYNMMNQQELFDCTQSKKL